MSKLARVGMHSPAMQQMGALYDGTQESLDNTPDIRMFTDQHSGQKCFCGVLQETRFELTRNIDVQVDLVCVLCRHNYKGVFCA